MADATVTVPRDGLLDTAPYEIAPPHQIKKRPGDNSPALEIVEQMNFQKPSVSLASHYGMAFGE